jgi:hypothetical protein
MKSQSILFGLSTLIIAVLLISSISALEFDNVKTYDPIKNEITSKKLSLDRHSSFLLIYVRSYNFIGLIYIIFPIFKF